MIQGYKVYPPLPDWNSTFRMPVWSVRQSIHKPLEEGHERIGGRCCGGRKPRRKHKK